MEVDNSEVEKTLCGRNAVFGTLHTELDGLAIINACAALLGAPKINAGEPWPESIVVRTVVLRGYNINLRFVERLRSMIEDTQAAVECVSFNGKSVYFAGKQAPDKHGEMQYAGTVAYYKVG